MSGLTVGGNLILMPTYKIDGQSVTAIEAQQFIEGGNDVSRLDIMNDGEMSSRVSGIRKGQKRTINETREVIRRSSEGWRRAR